MNNNQINIAIAMLRGWRFIENDPDYEPYWEDPSGNKIAVNFIEHRVPNCAGCLNAMHEAEKEMKPSDLTSYLEMLFDWLEADCIRASASTRAEAFLRTLGKWEEEV